MAGTDKILSKANSNDTETISKSDYQNALACLDMVLKNGHLLKNPEEKEIEQFSFFSPRSNYISTDEIKPINVGHKNTEKENPITSKQDSITFSQPGSVNYTITESTFSNLGGDKTRCQNNIAAIRLLKQILKEKSAVLLPMSSRYLQNILVGVAWQMLLTAARLIGVRNMRNF